MKRLLIHLLILIGLTAALLSTGAPVRAQAAQETQAVMLTARGALSAAMAEYIERGLETAAQRGAPLIILQLDTPGGSIDLMERIIQALRASPVPVVVYVAPNGAMAGSAGTLITLAGHLAAMAPETAIGAASPVDETGQDIGETMRAKVTNIMKATARSLAERRGEEAVRLAEDTIENAAAVSATEALAAGLIDIVAADVDDLLAQVDGQTVTVSGNQVTLRTASLSVENLPQTFVEQLLGLLANPNLVFVLLWLGVQALLIELSSPGGWVAGFLGVIALALAAYGLGYLPVNYFGLIFLVLAFVLFILDIKAPTHGALTVAGAASFIAGALVLFNSPGVPQVQRVSVPLIIVAGVITASVFFVAVTIALRAQRVPVRTGRESLLGRTGIARTAINPTGSVQVAGEQWTASTPPGYPPIPAGERVVVVRLDGLRLIVEQVL